MSSNCQDDNDDTWEQHQLEYDIIQVETVMMPDGESWQGTEDHSKWVLHLLLHFVSIERVKK